MSVSPFATADAPARSRASASESAQEKAPLSRGAFPNGRRPAGRGARLALHAGHAPVRQLADRIDRLVDHQIDPVVPEIQPVIVLTGLDVGECDFHEAIVLAQTGFQLYQDRARRAAAVAQNGFDLADLLAVAADQVGVIDLSDRHAEFSGHVAVGDPALLRADFLGRTPGDEIDALIPKIEEVIVFPRFQVAEGQLHVVTGGPVGLSGNAGVQLHQHGLGGSPPRW